MIAALNGMSSERYASISRMKDSTTTPRMKPGVRLAINSLRSEDSAVIPPTYDAIPSPSVAGGITFTRRSSTSAAVRGSAAFHSGVILMIATPPSVDTIGSFASTTPGVAARSARRSCNRGSWTRGSPGPVTPGGAVAAVYICETTTSGAVLPGPNPSAMASYACRETVSGGRLLASVSPRLSVNMGAARISRMRVDTIANGHGRFVTEFASLAHIVLSSSSWLGSSSGRSFFGRTRRPITPRIAGTSVSEAATASNTTMPAA